MEFHRLTLGIGWSVGLDVDNEQIVSKFVTIVNTFCSFKEHLSTVFNVAFFQRPGYVHE